MKKLKLNLDRLRVDTFELSEKELTERGTVHGNATLLCTRWASCQGSCPGTCHIDSCYNCSVDACETVAWTCGDTCA